MHVHILGICGTFMGSVALLARDMGMTITGSDLHVYPPMSTQLEKQGISLVNGYDSSQFTPRPDLIVVGNVLSRGNPAVEYVLSEGIPYTSGPSFIADYILKDRTVIAVAGTHGKTTISSMLSWILEKAGLDAGFLIGGVPSNFGVSARLGKSSHFVIEADEYDTAFFDKRSKFVHYRPNVVILNNMEFDHADIFDDITDIQKQFHHLVRTIPGNGLIIAPADDHYIEEVLEMGAWTPISYLGSKKGWQAHPLSKDASCFAVQIGEKMKGEVFWRQTGYHNMANGLSAIVAAEHIGIPIETSCQALASFEGVKRRMELLAEIKGVRIYDDFAHHPTAIRLTLEGLRANVGDAMIRAVIEPRSNTMKMGIHKGNLAKSTDSADQVVWFQPPDMKWSLVEEIKSSNALSSIENSIEGIIDKMVVAAKPGDNIVIMSNGGFGGIHEKLIEALRALN